MRFRKSRILATVATLALFFVPSFSCAKKSTSSHRQSNPMVNYKSAETAWAPKPRKDETTASLHKRVEKEITTLLEKNTSKLNYDTERWKLLGYLRELPWKDMTSRWKKWYLENQPNLRLTAEQRDAYLSSIKEKKLYQMTPKEVDAYIGNVHKDVPDFCRRVVALARKNINQPYKIYLLGEFPYEVYDADPMFSLSNSDCVVFAEHTYAMALSSDWPEFFRNLQKLRYKDGEVGMVTRNHFTEADWDKNNSWLFTDVTEQLGATTVTAYREKIDRARFFRNFGIGQDVPVEYLDDKYIPAEAVKGITPKLHDGDFVNIVRGIGDGVWVGHVGMIAHAADGTVTLIHSTEPRVKEQPIMQYVTDNLKKNVKRHADHKAEFKGFKFLRPNEQGLSNQQASASTTK